LREINEEHMHAVRKSEQGADLAQQEANISQEKLQKQLDHLEQQLSEKNNLLLEIQSQN